jgi:predicted CXXCH cytochrome family protein
MTQFATAESVRADFHEVTLTNETTRFVLHQTNDQFWVHMERPSPSGAGESATPSVNARLGLLTGSHHMQVFWIPSEQGNAQVGFPFTWLIPEKRWVPRNSTFIRPADAPHLGEIWNFSCSRCHTTAVEPLIDSVQHIAATRVGELGIACEACHGPGQRHVQARRAGDSKQHLPETVLATEIVQPRKLDPIRAAQVCGFCHSMKWFDSRENWRDQGFRYRPGDDLEQTTPIIRPAHLESVSGLSQYLERNPDLLRDFFWADGMVRVSGRDYNGLIESPCYKGGRFSCLSCHSMHKSEPAGLMARSRTGDQACTQCHEALGNPSKQLAHTHHPAGSSGSECYNCHMPRTTYGVLKAIRSHQVSSPRIADQLATGRPNACNLCHLDKTLAWSAEHLSAWYAQPKLQLTQEQSSVAEGVRLALAGDAGQRALLAWHFGWQPAVQTSGRGWIAPVLAQLLEDPYAAVRCIAERSLKSTGFANALPAEYDFAAPPPNPPALSQAVVDAWRDQAGAQPDHTWPPQTLVSLEDPTGMRRQFSELAKQRDDRPVRLRE